MFVEITRCRVPSVGWTVISEKVHFEELSAIISFSWWFRWVVTMFSVTKDGVLGLLKMMRRVTFRWAF